MATFAFKAGGTAGTIEAPDRAAAIRELAKRGTAPTSLVHVDASAKASAAIEPKKPYSAAARPTQKAVVTKRRGSVMSRSETAMFMRELATALQAGLPLVQSLRTLGRQGRSGGRQEMLESLIHAVEHGRSLSDAMAAWGKPFGDLTVNLTRAGEVSGRLGDVMMQTAELLDRDMKLRRSILGATLYPMILFVLIVCAIIVIVTWIVPQILSGLGGLTIELPWPTRVVQGTAAFFTNNWLAVLITTGAALLIGVKYYASPEGRMNVDRRLLKVPLLGPMLREVAVARFTRTLATLVSAGIPILTALRVTKGTLGNRAMEGVIDEVCDAVAAGRTIADPLEKSGYFPPMLVQIVNLGERSGRLDELLHQASRAFEERTEMSIKLFTTAFPPLLIVSMAGVVGFVVLAIVMALLQSHESVMRGV